MKDQKYNSLGLDVTLSVPESVAEFDSNANKDGACLSEAINNIVYRGSLAVFRDTFLHGDTEKGIEGIDKQTGIERLSETREQTSKNEDGTPKTTTVWVESEAKYWDRVKATLIKAGTFTDEKAVNAHFQAFADRVAAIIVFDASSTERKARGPKKLPKEVVEIVEKFIAGGKAEKLAAKLSKSLGREIAPTADALGHAIVEDLKREEQLRKTKLLEAAMA